jgi:hypothetical protein
MHLSRSGRNQGRQLAREQMIAEIGSHDWRDRRVREWPLLVGAMRREAMFGPVLTHWDEAAAYAVIGLLVSALF